MSKIIHYPTHKLKEFRETKGWSRGNLADFLTLELGKNVSQSTVEKWEKQERGIDAATALEMSKALSIPVSELVERKHGENSN